jgi:predicted phosphodiesterase
MSRGPILFAGDCHGQFRQVIHAAGHTRASAVVLLGDLEPERPLELELAQLVERGVPVHWIGGNHDADSDVLWHRVWGSKLADCCIHRRVVQLPDGRRLVGLSGVFRESVWYPSASAAREGAPAWRTRDEHARCTPRQDRWHDGPHRRHWGTIYPEDIDRLADLQADILVTHEAPGYHPCGFGLLDDLARMMGVRWSVHGHHHDALDSSAEWESQGFRSYGVGLRGVSALLPDGRWDVVVKGELDDERASRYRTGWP